MKIFISHASANRNYGNALVDLLTAIGISENRIIFTSNNAFGIPIGENIFNWLKNQITNKPYVIYLLSKEYYESIACLNEMGAAWVIENEHSILFTPDFDLTSKEFRDGAIDPREIGFYINNEERILAFIQHLSTKFTITTNQVLINQKVKKYLTEIQNLKDVVVKPKENNIEHKNSKVTTEENNSFKTIVNPNTTIKSVNTSAVSSKFLQDIIIDGKLKDEEILLIHYMKDTAQTKLKTGWQEDIEIKNIKDWEEINNLDSKLSKNYPATIRKFALRGYTEVSALTGSGNIKEVKLKDDIEAEIIDLPQPIINIIESIVEKYPTRENENNWDTF